MTNTEKLKQIIADSGYKMEFLAKECGCTRETLNKKINNKTLFNSVELKTLKDLLKIGDTEMYDIFFCS